MNVETSSLSQDTAQLTSTAISEVKGVSLKEQERQEESQKTSESEASTELAERMKLFKEQLALITHSPKPSPEDVTTTSYSGSTTGSDSGNRPIRGVNNKRMGYRGGRGGGRGRGESFVQRSELGSGDVRRGGESKQPPLINPDFDVNDPGEVSETGKHGFRLNPKYQMQRVIVNPDFDPNFKQRNPFERGRGFRGGYRGRGFRGMDRGGGSHVGYRERGPRGGDRGRGFHGRERGGHGGHWDQQHGSQFHPDEQYSDQRGYHQYSEQSDYMESYSQEEHHEERGKFQGKGYYSKYTEREQYRRTDEEQWPQSGSRSEDPGSEDKTEYQVDQRQPEMGYQSSSMHGDDGTSKGMYAGHSKVGSSQEEGYDIPHDGNTAGMGSNTRQLGSNKMKSEGPRLGEEGKDHQAPGPYSRDSQMDYNYSILHKSESQHQHGGYEHNPLADETIFTKRDAPTIPSLQKEGAKREIPGLGSSDGPEEEEKKVNPNSDKQDVEKEAEEEKDLKSSLKSQIVDVFGGSKAEKMIKSMERIVNQLQTLKGLESSLRVLQVMGEYNKESTEEASMEAARKKVAALLASESDSDGEVN